MKNKRGQMKLSFGMIFSIFLIIIFLAVAFYAISKFLNFQQELKYRQFIEDFGKDVEDMWKGTQGSQRYIYDMPSKVESVCFVKDDFYNLEIKFKKGLRTETIDHIDTTPFCINIENSKVRMILEKKYGENFVMIKKDE